MFRPKYVRPASESEGQLRGTTSKALFMGDRTWLVVQGIDHGLVIADVIARRMFRASEPVALARDADGAFTLGAVSHP